jgi:hypothetical protein
VDADHPLHLRLAAVAERDTEPDAMRSDVDSKGGDDQRQYSCIQSGDRHRHRDVSCD